MKRGHLPAPLPTTDADGDALTYTVLRDSLPRGLHLAADGRFSGSTSRLSGAYEITVSVADAGGTCVSLAVVLRVLDPRVPPTDVGVPGESSGGPEPLTAALLALIAGAALVGAWQALPIGRRRLTGRPR